MNDARPPALQFEQVGVLRGSNWIVRQVNWAVPRGACCAVLGPNGSGKTTLMRLISGFLWPTEGAIGVLGETHGQTDMQVLRRRIGIVDPASLYTPDGDLTSVEVALTGFFSTLSLYHTPTDAQNRRAQELVESVGLSHRMNHRFGVLSTGEQRRCLLARALVHVPELLILDEPTAGLDVAGRERLLATIQMLRKAHSEVTILLVTHHVEEIAPGTEQVLLLREGQVLACGSPEETLTPERLSQLFGCKVFVQKRSNRWWLEVLPEAWLDLVRGG